jgi:hypothetical protein
LDQVDDSEDFDDIAEVPFFEQNTRSSSFDASGLALARISTPFALNGTLLVSDSPSEREFAYASFAALGYEELAIKLIKVKEDSAGRTVAQEIKAGGTGNAKSEASALLSTLPVQVYLQIADDHQRGKAEAIRTILQQKGYVVPGIENVAGKADIPKNTNVRYYNDQDKAIAEAIVSILKDQGLSTAYAYRVARFKARPGSIEIWFSSDAV